MCVHILRGNCKRRRILYRTSPPVPHLFEVGSCSTLETSKANLMYPVGYGLRRSSAGQTKSDGWYATIRGYQFKTPWRIIRLVHLGSRVKPTSSSTPPPFDHLASRQNRNPHYCVSLPKFAFRTVGGLRHDSSFLLRSPMVNEAGGL